MNALLSLYAVIAPRIGAVMATLTARHMIFDQFKLKSLRYKDNLNKIIN